ncbi:uncharacterized protein LOC131311556 [Rhododendron vialii]|uniref:uncharacterized protein LOC131311556 n=1 Tax=Rhododendron vialii TaxID=182163 RepID=UPI00265F84AE|nr:uncharacterized protein LOC131311556 [Rhododendron vialii]
MNTITKRFAATSNSTWPSVLQRNQKACKTEENVIRRGQVQFDASTSDSKRPNVIQRVQEACKTQENSGCVDRIKDNIERESATTSDKLEEPQAEKIKREHPKELNPYLKNNGSGYPEVKDGKKAGGDQHMSSSVVGDGGAGWRLKALYHAQEQAAREGWNFKEVVEERWGSMGQLTVSVASRTTASSRAHLHAINNRKRGLTGEHQTIVENHNEKIPGKNTGVDNLRDVSCCRSEMKVPKLHDSLSWGKQKDFGLISSALSSLNEFANDGSSMNEVTRQKDDEPEGSVVSPNREKKVESESIPSASFTVVNEGYFFFFLDQL